MSKMYFLYHLVYFQFFCFIYPLMIIHYIYWISINFHLVIFIIVCSQIFYFLHNHSYSFLYLFDSHNFLIFIISCYILSFYFMIHFLHICFCKNLIRYNTYSILAWMKIVSHSLMCYSFFFQILILYFFSWNLVFRKVYLMRLWIHLWWEARQATLILQEEAEKFIIIIRWI